MLTMGELQWMGVCLQNHLHIKCLIRDYINLLLEMCWFYYVLKGSYILLYKSFCFFCFYRFLGEYAVRKYFMICINDLTENK